ncbi:hypothetical protein [Natronoglomus mannanivorans]|uniref:Uncharacterized protein n=1 Tax=Natronoglomus mannanivorans TaxID=2979990 RepID=A0AAP2Z0U3_9EURY|nr:hypothetical protein [Halobacteria archaeon AArc-xg1-1]
MSRLSLLVVLLIVLTAGCSGLPGETGAPDREPYGVDEQLESSLTDPGEHVVGLTEEGFQNDSFVRDHREVLTNQSHTTSQSTTATLANGTVLLENEESTTVDVENRRSLRHGQTTGSWNLDVREADRERTTVQYRSENDQLSIGQPVVRIEHGNGTVEYERGYDSSPRAELYSLLSPLREAEEIEIERARYADGHYTVVEGTEPAAGSMFLEDEPFSVQVFVRDDGLIRYVDLEGTIQRTDERVSIEQEFVVEDIGEVSVEEPDWYEEALEELEGDVTVSEADV